MTVVIIMLASHVSYDCCTDTQLTYNACHHCASMAELNTPSLEVFDVLLGMRRHTGLS
jgi:hypothetical protein